ncbi:hypothetical protein BX600DRAFT_122841 [Xylariales sp. PMI_506]|nr:hypothetical protein BX600DRAFT_122841 [Xylariales sp. PMI_506]
MYMTSVSALAVLRLGAVPCLGWAALKRLGSHRGRCMHLQMTGSQAPKPTLFISASSTLYLIGRWRHPHMCVWGVRLSHGCRFWAHTLSFWLRQSTGKIFEGLSTKTKCPPRARNVLL